MLCQQPARLVRWRNHKPCLREPFTPKKVSNGLNEHLIAEWLGQELDAVPERRRQISTAIAGYEQERDTPLRKNGGHLVDAFASKVDIQHRSITRAFSSQAYRAGKSSGRSYDPPSRPRQDRLDLSGDKKFVLNH